MERRKVVVVEVDTGLIDACLACYILKERDIQIRGGFV